MFTDLPRYMGFPSQIWVKKRFAFDSFVRMFNGKRPMMVSTYQFKDRTTPVVDSLVFDIDSYFGLRIPYKNTKSLIEFCRENKLQYIILIRQTEHRCYGSLRVPDTHTFPNPPPRIPNEALCEGLCHQLLTEHFFPLPVNLVP